MSEKLMKIGITGVSGLVGFHLADNLLAGGNTVIGLSRRKNCNVEDLLKYEWFQFVAGDVTDVNSLEPFSSMEVLYHLAAQSTIWQSKTDPIQDCKTNILGTVTVLDFSKAHHVGKLIFTSGGAVYPDQYMVDENVSGIPDSFYGLSKWTAEQYCRLHAKEFGVKTSILRLSRVYGPRMSRNAIYDMLTGFVEERPIKLYASLESEHDFIYVKDVVSALVQAFDPAWDDRVVNVSSGYGAPLHSLYEMLCGLFGFRPRVEIVNSSVTKDVLLNKKALALGWKPKYKLEDGLKETMDRLLAEFTVGKQ